LEKDGIADPELDTLRSGVLRLSLHGKDHEVAAAGGFPGENVLTDDG
jgi:hypothetical protein